LPDYAAFCLALKAVVRVVALHELVQVFALERIFLAEAYNEFGQVSQVAERDSAGNLTVITT